VAERCRADADAVGSNGSYPLHLASAGDHKNVAELQLSRGVDAGRRNVPPAEESMLVARPRAAL